MKVNFKIVFLGDSSVGKSSLIATTYFSENIPPNLGTNFMTKEIMIDGKTATVQFWDMPGLPSLRSSCIPYYRGADCCVLVYDVTSLESFQSLVDWQNEFLNEISIPKGQRFPFVVIGNKIDRNNRKVDREWARLWSENIQALAYFETSAKDSTNVKELIQFIVKYLLDYNQKNVRQTENSNELVSHSYCCGLFSMFGNFLR